MNKQLLSISAATQQMQVLEHNTLLNVYPISTAALGLGEDYGSFKTPRGLHLIRAKIGAGLPINTAFIKRRPTGEIFSDDLAKEFPDRDWILSRILWLSGLEKGKNRLGSCDSMRRFIYIHGTDKEAAIGTPTSKGCIRMRNQDILELFDWVQLGCRVIIHE